MHRVAFPIAAAFLAFPATSPAEGGNYTFDGGTKKERGTVVSALEASSFDWSLLPGSIAIHIVHGEPSRSLPHRIWFDADLLESVPGLAHDEYGCERFASTLAWSFWPSRENSMHPTHRGDESAAMAPAMFRTLISKLMIGPARRSTRKH